MRLSTTASAATAGFEAGRIAEIDVLRGVAIAGVVMRHVSWQLLTPGNVAAPGGWIIAAACIASDVGVSLFVAVSAFGLAWRYAAPFGGLEAWLAFLAARASRLLPAYVLWSLVSLAARDPSLLASPSTIASALFFGTADVQFYYVPMVFELYLLWPLLRPLVTVRSAGGALLVLAGGAAIAELAWRTVLPSPWTPLLFLSTAVATGCVLPQLLAMRSPSESPGANPFAWRRSHAGAVVVLSAIAAIALFSCVTRFAAFAPGAASRSGLFMVTMLSAGQQAVFNASTIALLAVLAAPIARTRIGAWTAALGRMSYGVFLLHLLVASTVVYRVFAMDAPAPGGAGGALLRMLAAWLVILLGSYGITRLLGRIPGLAWTVGVRD